MARTKKVPDFSFPGPNHCFGLRKRLRRGREGRVTGTVSPSVGEGGASPGMMINWLIYSVSRLYAYTLLPRRLPASWQVVAAMVAQNLAHLLPERPRRARKRKSVPPALARCQPPAIAARSGAKEGKGKRYAASPDRLLVASSRRDSSPKPCPSFARAPKARPQKKERSSCTGALPANRHCGDWQSQDRKGPAVGGIATPRPPSGSANAVMAATNQTFARTPAHSHKSKARLCLEPCSK
jgi:hypothetical protein